MAPTKQIASVPVKETIQPTNGKAVARTGKVIAPPTKRVKTYARKKTAAPASSESESSCSSSSASDDETENEDHVEVNSTSKGKVAEKRKAPQGKVPGMTSGKLPASSVKASAVSMAGPSKVVASARASSSSHTDVRNSGETVQATQMESQTSVNLMTVVRRKSRNTGLRSATDKDGVSKSRSRAYNPANHGPHAELVEKTRKRMVEVIRVACPLELSSVIDDHIKRLLRTVARDLNIPNSDQDLLYWRTKKADVSDRSGFFLQLG